MNYATGRTKTDDPGSDEEVQESTTCSRISSGDQGSDQKTFGERWKNLRLRWPINTICSLTSMHAQNKSQELYETLLQISMQNQKFNRSSCKISLRTIQEKITCWITSSREVKLSRIINLM